MMLPLLWSFFSQGSSSEELHTSAKILLYEALMLLRDLSHSFNFSHLLKHFELLCPSFSYWVSGLLLFHFLHLRQLHSYQFEEQNILLHKSDSDEVVEKKELLHL